MQIRWGSYASYEGPYHLGTVRFDLPEEPTENDKILAAITATEGGHWDTINRYDACIDTQGLIQGCNRAPQHWVDNLYGVLCEQLPEAVTPMLDFFADRDYKFRKNENGRYRFFHPVDLEIDTPKKQRKLYFLNSRGLRGKWDEESKEYAKDALDRALRVWQHPEAVRIQRDFTVPKLIPYYVIEPGLTILESTPKDNKWAEAYRAMYISFAVNNPLRASKALEKGLRSTAGTITPWTRDWFIYMANMHTFDPGFAIYPGRYARLRPVLEECYGIDIPDFADETTNFLKENRMERFADVVEVQRALLALGHDLGPAGADGVFGKKSRKALSELEMQYGRDAEEADGLLDPETCLILERALEEKGIVELR